jgi:stress-induced morphogen
MTLDELKERIRVAIPGAHVEVTDLTGTADHYQALVVAPEFAGLSRIEQHRRVYGALGASMGGDIHALALKTFSPDAWRANGKVNGERT